MQTPLISPFGQRRIWRWVLAAVIVVIAIWLASRIPRTLTIFVLGAFIAFGVEPAVRRLERRLPRGAAIAIVYVVLLAALVVLAFLVIPATLAQVQSLINHAPDYIAAIQAALTRSEDALRARLGPRVVPPGDTDVQQFVSSRFAPFFTATLSSVGQIVIGTATALFVALSALVLSSFFLLQNEAIAATLYGAFPKHRQPAIRALGDEIATIFSDYVAGQTILCAVVGVSIFALTAAIGFKFALLTGIIGGILYAVPFLGLLIVHGIALILAAPQGAWMVLWVQVVLFGVGRIADNLLVPKIMSESIGVSPIVVMFAVFAGGELFGLPGLLLGIPAAALAKVVWKFFRTVPVASRIITPEEVAAPEPPLISTPRS
ncbi:MAG: AI-2E family transporter [Candidatus Eremiobacteraeota bacterium]|nr:AI-2E family transporter [Candidatus Eremiobacteraeota bacterium]